MKMLFPALICCGLVLLSAGPSFGQDTGGGAVGADPVSDEPADQGFVLNIEVNLVNLFVSVLDRKGHVVSDLEKEDFYLWEGGERREISNFSTDPDAPLSMAVMLDVSGSMGLMQKLNNSRMAVELLVEHLNDPDEAALLAFAGTSVEQLVPFTSERDRLVQELETLKPFGKTALYRAIEEVPELLGSPLTNLRQDQWGGALENRLSFPLRVAAAVRDVWPENLPLFVRISCTDWVDNGWDLAQSIDLCGRLKSLGVDFIDCSSGGTVPDARIPAGPGFQAVFSAAIRKAVGIATGAVGLITSPAQAEQVLVTEQADAVLLGREFLRTPYWPLLAAADLGVDLEWPDPYKRAKPV